MFGGFFRRYQMLTPKEYIDTYTECFIQKFRDFVADEYEIEICGLGNFIQKNSDILNYLIERLNANKFLIRFQGKIKYIEAINISCKNSSKGELYNYTYQIQNLPAIIEFSSKTDIPIIVIFTMRIVAQTIVKTKTLYKAFVFDLDETLWPGVLREIGVKRISDNLQTKRGETFISFMKFIKTLANELGIFIALCSRNKLEEVEVALNYLNENSFPLKNQIDYIVANDNDKSLNIKEIAEKLSILPNSMVFIDDNQIIRDEVRRNVPEVFVPNWESHNDLITLMITVCIFEKNELSINSQNKRIQYKTIQIERKKNALPPLIVKAICDNNHSEALTLYSKSNQFKFSQNNGEFYNDSTSVYYEIYRENKESLGICSAITYRLSDNELHVYNWAISCRFFEIGLEETILQHLHHIGQTRKLTINYTQTDYNSKVSELIDKYPDIFVINKDLITVDVLLSEKHIDILKENTNLKLI